MTSLFNSQNQLIGKLPKEFVDTFHGFFTEIKLEKGDDGHPIVSVGNGPHWIQLSQKYYYSLESDGTEIDPSLVFWANGVEGDQISEFTKGILETLVGRGVPSNVRLLEPFLADGTKYGECYQITNDLLKVLNVSSSLKERSYHDDFYGRTVTLIRLV